MVQYFSWGYYTFCRIISGKMCKPEGTAVSGLQWIEIVPQTEKNRVIDICIFNAVMDIEWLSFYLWYSEPRT